MDQHYQPGELATLKANVAANPHNLDDILKLADAYRQQGAYYDIIDTYKRAIDIAPDEANLHYNLGTIYEVIDKLDEAYNAYVKATTVNPKFSKAYYKIGSLHEQHQRLSEAIQAYEKCAKYAADADIRSNAKQRIKQLTLDLPPTIDQSQLAYRLTALILLLGASINIISWFLLGNISPYMISTVVDVILAIGLLQFRTGARSFTLFRTVVGAVLGPILFFVNNDIVTALVTSAIQWGYCGSILLLLTGQTKTWRVILAGAIAALVLGCNGLSLLLLIFNIAI
jgi:tetratricopeptide (TPR) repeat protein